MESKIATQQDTRFVINSLAGLWVFLDNSNLWIETKKCYGLRLKNKFYKEDPRVRIDPRKLVTALLGSRQVEEAILYGSEPPAVVSYWEHAKKKNWIVKRFEKSAHSGKEKVVDTAIVTDITHQVAYSKLRQAVGEIKYEDGHNVIILVSGDGDMKPAVEKVIEQGGIWKIEIVGLKDTMSAELKNLATSHPDIVQTTFLDPESFSYIQMVHSRRVGDQKAEPIEMLPFDFGDIDVHSHGILLEDVKVEDLDWLQKKIPKWPFVYQKKVTSFEDGTLQTDMMIVLIPPNNMESKENMKPNEVMDKIFPEISSQMKKLCRSAKTFASVCSSRTSSVTKVVTQNKFTPESDSWSSVNRKKSTKVAGKTSFPCQHHFFCQMKMKCTRTHTKEEEEFFKSGMRPKTLMCKFLPGCKNGANCKFAHQPSDFFCSGCKLKGHLVEACKERKVGVLGEINKVASMNS